MIRIISSLTLFIFLGVCCPAFGQKTEVIFGKKSKSKADPHRALKLKMQNTKITLDFQDTPLVEVFDFIKDVADVNIVLSPKVRKDEEYSEKEVTIKLTDLKVSSCINLLCRLYKLSARYTSGVLYIAPKGEEVRKLYLEVYDTRDLVFQIKNFPGPKITLSQKKDEGVTPSALFSEPEEKNVFNDAEELLNLIRDNVGNDWDQEGHSISVHGKMIIAVTTKPVHRKIKELVLKLRAYK